MRWIKIALFAASAVFFFMAMQQGVGQKTTLGTIDFDLSSVICILWALVIDGRDR